ncbi:IclR family transcriptional regulator [Rhodovulum sulfidophilum]|uniref:IclR family transcriptional regulator n=1 Tax=Rhodovulum sulfidophilum TaxID=35806 RepID=UPI0009528137|nr:IclR family transcriptional regulator [Rhodovulum sulfidophilum]OLS50938.1 hypothetical protein BV392_02250 [Rhodovulum sulfidophilum]
MAVRQADNVLRFFEYFAASQRPTTLTELSEALKLPLSSTSNLVSTLRERGFLFEVRKRGGFYPTRRMYDLTLSILDGDPVLGLVREHMEALREETGETILLAAREGDRVIYLEALESRKGVRYSARPGETRPIYAISSGKAILAALDDAALRREIDRLDYSEAAEASITDRVALFDDIVSARARGWFLNASEYTPEVSAVGMLLDIAEQKYGLSVAGPNYRMQGRYEEIAAALGRVVAAIKSQIHETGAGR